MHVECYDTLLLLQHVGGQCQECAAGLTKDQTFPVCPGALVTYTCTVAGTNFTAWTGSGFFQFCNDTLNETIITHYLIESTDLNNTFINESECGPFLALRNDAETTVGCYVSNLEFSATSPGPFNGTTVECFDGDGIRIGTDIVGIAGEMLVVRSVMLSGKGHKRIFLII